MLMRRTMGISLAVLMISAGAMAKTAEKGTSYHPSHPHGAKPHQAGQPTGKPHTASSKGAHHRLPARYAAHHPAPRHRHPASHSVAAEGGGPPDPYLASAEAFSGRQIGTAAWYNRVGAHTSTGERLDAVTATAAHRTLSLGSFARVTNLDSGRSVIVRINDRGPQTRRFIIDLSPRAADELDLRRTGVATVVVEPVDTPTFVAQTAATFQNAGTSLRQ